MPDAPKSLWPIALVFLCSILGSVGQGFFKRASDILRETSSFGKPLAWITNWQLLVGLSFYGLATVLFVYAISKGNLSILYPVIALSYVWVLLIAIWFFHEKTSAFNWVGVGFIILGVALVAIGRSG
ncbi:MAG: EamA family transporter [Planctomycetota bacterium]|jgi:drug/metabolite transporter (DMT)-like permease